MPRTGDNAVPQLTEGWASLGIAAAMYDQGQWRTLVDAMSEALKGDGTSLMSAATSQVTNRVTLGNFEDLVIYVQNVPRTGAADDPDNDFDVNNQWASGTDPGCTLKGDKTVLVDARLYDIEPMAYKFMVNFARDNQLQVDWIGDTPL